MREERIGELRGYISQAKKGDERVGRLREMLG
jgi:hypothetical protein